MKSGQYDKPFTVSVTDSVGNPSQIVRYEQHQIVCSSKHGNFKDPTAYSFSIRDQTKGEMYYQSVAKGNKSSASGGYTVSTPNEVLAALSSTASRCSNSCLNSFYDSLDSDTNLAASFAEAVRTKVTAGSNQIVKSVNDRRRQESFRRRSVKGASGAYLLASFGILPIMGDIFGTIDACRNQITNKSFRVTATSSKTENVRGVWPFTVLSRTGNGQFQGSVTSRCKMSAWFKVNPLSFLTGLTSLDPSVIAWELTPYSFVVDYFYNIGGYLRNLELAAQYQSAYQGGYKTVTSKYNWGFQPPRMLGNTATGVSGYATSYSENLKKLDRSGQGVLPKPGPPQFECDLGSGQLMNCAAVLGALIK